MGIPLALAAAAGCGGGGFSCCGSGTAEHTQVVVTPGPASQPTTVTLRVGQLLTIPELGLEQAETSRAGILVPLNPNPGVAQFRAAQVGQTTVTLIRAPACAPSAAACPQYRVAVAAVKVVVNG